MTLQTEHLRWTATDLMLHTGRGAKDGQLQIRGYTQGVTLLYRRTATDSMLHIGRDAKDGQLQIQCYTQGVTLQTNSYRFSATHRE